MTCKRYFIGSTLSQDDWNYGLGSIYLAGPTKSWKFDFIKKVEKEIHNAAFLIPETENKKQLSDDEIFSWKKDAISVASIIVFWFPKNNISDIDSYVEFGYWCKSERVFYGREDNLSNKYLDWIFNKEQSLYPAETLDQLADMVIHWLRE
jgi:hypothetical protein